MDFALVVVDLLMHLVFLGANLIFLGENCDMLFWILQGLLDLYVLVPRLSIRSSSASGNSSLHFLIWGFSISQFYQHIMADF